VPENNIRTFTRSAGDTIVGLIHVLAGSLSFFYSLTRIILIGFSEVFKYGHAIGIYNYYNEFTSILLWLSGIGILRSRKWGRIIALIWAVSVILLDIISYRIRYNYWGIIALKSSWSNILIIYYATFLIIYLSYKPVYRFLRDRIDFNKIDFSYFRRRFYNIIYWRRK